MGLDLTPIERYLQDGERTPFFLFAGEAEYEEARRRLQGMGLHVFALSSLCPGEDRFPFWDDVIGTLRKKIQAGEKLLFVGLGEYLALRGAEEAEKMFLHLKALPCGTGAIVLLLRSLLRFSHILSTDPRIIGAERRMAIRHAEGAGGNVLGLDVTLTVLPPGMPVHAMQGVRALLETLEQGQGGAHVLCSRQCFSRALICVRQAEDAFAVLSLYREEFSPLRLLGTEEQWRTLLQELSGADWDMSAVLMRYELGGDLAQDVFARARASGFRRWLYFIALRLAGEAFAREHRYLAFAVGQTEKAEMLCSALIHAIAKISLQDVDFPALYQERKHLLRGCLEEEMAVFVRQNRKTRTERIHRLTDMTEVEREDIIAALSRDDAGGYDDWKNCKVLQDVYPALFAYADDYVFRDCARAKELTDYFIAYKRQKLSNCLEEDFLHWVDALASMRIYNEFPTREALLEQIPQEGTHLFWLDALGVEYLSLMTACAKQLNLQIHVQVGRARLPTITSLNKAFYENWKGSKEKDQRLDDLKHGEKSRYNYTEEKHPIHLAKEIAVIEETMRYAATQLAAGSCRRFLIASDHGASRLAVRREKEEKYPTDTGGEHAGRCCRMFSSYAHDLHFATEEDGYLVLADYGRFAGSRKASVEVHGGASLEEVLVPLIILERIEGRTAHVSLTDERVLADRKTGVRFVIFVDVPVKALRVVFEGRNYAGKKQDAQHFVVQIADITHAGSYPLHVYEEEALLGMLDIEVQSKGFKVNDDFDF